MPVPIHSQESSISMSEGTIKFVNPDPDFGIISGQSGPEAVHVRIV